VSLLINGALVDAPGLTTIPPASRGGPVWAYLHPGDWRARTTTPWVRQLIVHTTGGNWPQPVLPGSGPGGHARNIAEMWAGIDHGGGERIHSAAQLIVDTNGDVVCLCDLGRTVAYHAEGSNPWSVGIEMCTLRDGAIFQATLDATAKLVDFLCYPTLPIPRQMPRGPYRNAPLRRMELGTGNARHNSGGQNCVGVFGHRDNTSERGYGDPGNVIWTQLAALGFEGWDFDGAEDLAVGRRRQEALNARGESLTIDGVVGPASLAAAARQRFARWRDVAP
jgi:hypothetical protein